MHGLMREGRNAVFLFSTLPMRLCNRCPRWIAQSFPHFPFTALIPKSDQSIVFDLLVFILTSLIVGSNRIGVCPMSLSSKKPHDKYGFDYTVHHKR